MTRPATIGETGTTRAERPNPGRGTRHRLIVLANDTAETIAAAGGLLFDRGGAGWNVEVYLEDPAVENAFAILGVHSDTLHVGLRSMRIWPDALIVSARLRDARKDIRAIFNAAARRHTTEVAMWGGAWPIDAGSGIGRVEHRLSVAARAFKPRAMSAAGLSHGVEHVEQFVSGKRRFTLAAPLTAPT